MRNAVIKLMLTGVLVLASSCSKPEAPTVPQGQAAEQPMRKHTPKEYKLTQLTGPSKTEEQKYQLPSLAGERLQEICRSDLLLDVLSTGASIRIQLVYSPLTEDTNPSLVERGMHVLSAEPLVFTARDTVTIKVRDFTLDN